MNQRVLCQPVRAAFTLIEALIAILLIAAVLPVAVGAITRAVDAAGDTRRLDTARRIAEARLALLIADKSWAVAQGSGACDPAVDGEDSEGFRWAVSVEPWTMPTLSVLSVRVMWGIGEDAEDPRGITMTTLVTEPPQAAP